MVSQSTWLNFMLEIPILFHLFLYYCIDYLSLHSLLQEAFTHPSLCFPPKKKAAQGIGIVPVLISSHLKESFLSPLSLSMYTVPGIGLSSLHSLCYWILLSYLWINYHHSHLANEETGTEKWWCSQVHRASKLRSWNFNPLWTITSRHPHSAMTPPEGQEHRLYSSHPFF